jgi:hypothetical protein
MKKLIFVLAFIAIAVTACPQKVDQSFDASVLFKKSITVVDTIFFGDKTFLKTAPTGSGPVLWDNILNKPSMYPPLPHNHDALYRPITWKPDYNTEILNVPKEISLAAAIEQLGYLPIPQKTTAEINAIVLAAGKSGIIMDKTLGVYKLWSGTAWSKIVITNQ